ncbi:MAG: phosphoribosylglycinamide formyltransferase [Gemmatimonadota bacterium]
MTERPLTVAAFASGGGTNLQALLDHHADPPRWRIGLVVLNREAGAGDRARAAGVPVVVIPTKDRDPDVVAVETLSALREADVDVITLCGYLRLLPAEVVARYAGRILNIHPALLPDFGGKGMYGMNVHRAVVDAGVAETGATVHYVTEQYDEGGILGQWRVDVRPDDTPEDVAARVLRVEHQLYPRVLDHLAEALQQGRGADRLPDVRLAEPPPTDTHPPTSGRSA